MLLDLDKDLSFVILLTEFRFAGLRMTASTIGTNFNNPDCICVVPQDSNKEDLKTVKTICNSVEGGKTISSMINTGIHKSNRPWNLIVMAGNMIRYSPLLKYQRFLESEKDVIYRVSDKAHWRWEDASIHGILMHKKAIEEIGDFTEDESLQFCRVLWEAKAMEKGYKMKGLVGVKLI